MKISYLQVRRQKKLKVLPVTTLCISIGVKQERGTKNKEWSANQPERIIYLHL
jgi:hypothetical protein